MEKLPGIAQAQESLSIITTLLLSPGSGQSTSKTFYAHFLMRMKVTWTDTLQGRPLTTAGVSITDKINFYINPTYFNSLSPQGQMDLVEHEVEHIVYKHPIRAKDYLAAGPGMQQRQKISNIAMDANINQNKQASANEYGWVTLDRLNKELKEMKGNHQLDDKDAWEKHYEKLMQAIEDNDGEGAGEGAGQADDHECWGESTDNAEIAEGIIKDVSNKAQAATGIGNMPQNMLREIANMNKATVNWKRQLNQFFTRSLNFEFEKTRNRRNRRYGLIQPGRKKKPQLKVAICVDSSGSVSDASFSQFFAEISEISTLGVDITIIDADCQVQSVYKYDKRNPPQRTGAGGTAYGPAIQHAKGLGVDGILYLGDFDCADTPEDPKIPFLWVGVGNQPAPANFGRVIRIVEEAQ